MKFIDKTAFMPVAHQITDSYLQNECKIDDGNGDYHFQNVEYDGNFNASGAKGRMEDLCLQSQDGYCCYCMRIIKKKDNTLEHIIPQSVSESAFEQYMESGMPWLSRRKVIRTADFTGVENITVPPRPHTVTFENLTASCDGRFPENGASQCCNNHRGNKKIFPLFYLSDITDKLRYMSDGTVGILSGNTAYAETISNVNLNCQNLKDIRRLWKLVSVYPMKNIVDCLYDRDSRIQTLRKVLYKEEGKEAIDNNIFIKYSREAYWKTFLRYQWFYKRI